MKKILSGLVLLSVLLTSCKQDYVNPNQPTQEQVFAVVRGITSAAISLQRTYTVGRNGVVYTSIIAGGSLTNEFRLINQGNTDEFAMFNGGGAVDNVNGIVNNLWIQCNKVVWEADNVITAANKLGDKNYASGLVAYASVFKALSIGTMATFWEQVPTAPGTAETPATFHSRQDAYRRAVKVIDDALAAMSANPISASFISNVPTGIDYANTLNALKARYSLFAGDYGIALAAANLVSLSSKSEFRYDGAVGVNNPIYETATATNNVVQPLDSTLGLPGTTGNLQPDLTDKRVPFYTSINTVALPRYRIAGFFTGNAIGIPIYLPDEMRLIKAECYVRQTSPNLASAKTEIDAVRTQTPAADAFGVGAELPVYSGAVDAASLLTEIYRNRCIELYMSGLRLEDNRRFGRPAAERKRNFFPYPFRERDNNPNTPADPAG
jgi:starch-binding outer membrane protein, SusD/RagB family